MKVLIIYCHPSKNSFTYEVKEAFIKGLESAGHSYEVLAGRGHDFVIRENGFLHCIIFANVVSCKQRIIK